MFAQRPHKIQRKLPLSNFRDPLDQYSDWPCNKCDFSLEVTFSPLFVPFFWIEDISVFFEPFVVVACNHYNPPEHQVPDLERKIDQMEEELNDLSAK